MEIESVQRAIKQLKQIQITQLYHSVASFLVGASLDHKAKNIIQRLTINCESLTLVQAVSPQTLIAQLTRIFKFTFFHVVQISLVSMAHPTCSKSVKTTCLDFSSPFLSLPRSSSCLTCLDLVHAALYYTNHSNTTSPSVHLSHKPHFGIYPMHLFSSQRQQFQQVDCCSNQNKWNHLRYFN